MNILKKIDTYEEYTELLKKAKSQFVFSRTNLYLFPNEVKEFIEKNSFSCCAEEHSLSFLNEERDIFRCYFCASEEAETIWVPKQLKYVVAECPWKDHSAVNASIKVLLQNSGFSFLRTTIRMKMDLSIVEGGDVGEVVSLSAVSPDVISSFLYQHFDVRADFIPTMEEIITYATEDLIYGTLDANRNITSCVLMIKNRKQLELRAIAVDKSFRGMGLGKKLCNTVIKKAKTLECRTVYLWTAEDNHLAQRMYQNAGFCADSCGSDLYYLDKEVLL